MENPHMQQPIHKKETSESLQKYLDENVRLIHQLLELQRTGGPSSHLSPESTRIQHSLHANLIYLATLADQQQPPPASVPVSGGPGGVPVPPQQQPYNPVGPQPLANVPFDNTAGMPPRPPHPPPQTMPFNSNPNVLPTNNGSGPIQPHVKLNGNQEKIETLPQSSQEMETESNLPPIVEATPVVEQDNQINSNDQPGNANEPMKTETDDSITVDFKESADEGNTHYSPPSDDAVVSAAAHPVATAPSDVLVATPPADVSVATASVDVLEVAAPADVTVVTAPALTSYSAEPSISDVPQDSYISSAPPPCGDDFQSGIVLNDNESHENNIAPSEIVDNLPEDDSAVVLSNSAVELPNNIDDTRDFASPSHDVTPEDTGNAPQRSSSEITSGTVTEGSISPTSAGTMPFNPSS